MLGPPRHFQRIFRLVRCITFTVLYRGAPGMPWPWTWGAQPFFEGLSHPALWSHARPTTRRWAQRQAASGAPHRLEIGLLPGHCLRNCHDVHHIWQ